MHFTFSHNTHPNVHRHLTRWYSRVSIQGRGQEIADGLKMCVKSALTKYHELNGALPERVVVFRDGVGDGQMSTVQNYEVAQMKEAFSMFGELFLLTHTCYVLINVHHFVSSI